MKKVTSLSKIENITGGDKASMQELLSVFMEEASLQVQKLQAYLSNGNLEELKHTAHKVKSSFLLIGLDKYKPLAEKIEEKAGENLKKTKEEVTELISIYTQAISELKTNLEKFS